jgi:hypothetical protein
LGAGPSRLIQSTLTFMSHTRKVAMRVLSRFGVLASERARGAVGTTVARRPPHRPVLALLTHTVPTLEKGARTGFVALEYDGPAWQSWIEWRERNEPVSGWSAGTETGRGLRACLGQPPGGDRRRTRRRRAACALSGA